MRRILACIFSAFLLGTVCLSAQDSASTPATPAAPVNPSDDELLSKFTITMKTSLEGTLGTTLSDKSLFIKALKDSGKLQAVSDFLSGTKVTVVSYADDDDNVSIIILDSGFKKNLLVKNPDPTMLDYIDTRLIFSSIGPVLNLYATYVKRAVGSFNIQIGQYFGLTHDGQSCIFSFVYGSFSAQLGPITMLMGSDEQYQIDGRFGPPGILYIPAPVDKLTGKKQTSSLIYSFFE